MIEEDSQLQTHYYVKHALQNIVWYTVQSLRNTWMFVSTVMTVGKLYSKSVREGRVSFNFFSNHAMFGW